MVKSKIQAFDLSTPLPKWKTQLGSAFIMWQATVYDKIIINLQIEKSIITNLVI